MKGPSLDEVFRVEQNIVKHGSTINDNMIAKMSANITTKINDNINLVAVKDWQFYSIITFAASSPLIICFLICFCIFKFISVKKTCQCFYECLPSLRKKTCNQDKTTGHQKETAKEALELKSLPNQVITNETSNVCRKSNLRQSKTTIFQIPSKSPTLKSRSNTFIKNKAHPAASSDKLPSIQFISNNFKDQSGPGTSKHLSK